MKELISNFYNKFLGSLDTKPGSGFSGRKLTAFALVSTVLAIHIKWITLGDFSQLELVLTIDYSFIAALFGMTTYQSIKEKKDQVGEVKGKLNEQANEQSS